jgi:hypothetical protein
MEAIMEYTVSERTITVRTTEPGEQLTRETVQALTGRTEARQTVERLALAAPETTPEQPSEIDTSYDPLELHYEDVSPEVLANEFAGYDLANMVPANILAAE